MTESQRLWWEQARSDYSVFRLMSRQGVSQCHQLHYFQMVTEKLGKAYYWRTGKAPKQSHASFVRFLQTLGDRKDRDGVARVLDFASVLEMDTFIVRVAPLAHDVERLAPSLAGDGPNPEYPWPRAAPLHAPASHSFTVWSALIESGLGRQFLAKVEVAIREFPRYC